MTTINTTAEKAQADAATTLQAAKEAATAATAAVREAKKEAKEAKLLEDAKKKFSGKTPTQLVAWAAVRLFSDDPEKAATFKKAGLLAILEADEVQRLAKGEGSMANLKAAKAANRYTKTKIGKKVAIDNDDGLAQLLRGLEVDRVAFLADRVFDEEIGFHLAKYSHLNNGQVRMCSGNRIRNQVKKGNVNLAALESFLAATS